MKKTILLLAVAALAAGCQKSNNDYNSTDTNMPATVNTNYSSMDTNSMNGMTNEMNNGMNGMTNSMMTNQ